MSKIYAASEVYMMQDKSENKQDTWDFVERRIDEVMVMGKFVNQNSGFAQAVGGGLQSIMKGVFVPPNKPTQQKQSPSDNKQTDDQNKQ